MVTCSDAQVDESGCHGLTYKKTLQIHMLKPSFRLFNTFVDNSGSPLIKLLTPQTLYGQTEHKHSMPSNVTHKEHLDLSQSQSVCSTIITERRLQITDEMHQHPALLRVPVALEGD